MVHGVLITHTKVLIISITKYKQGQGKQQRLINSKIQQRRGLLFQSTEGVTNLPHYKNSRPENLSGSEKKIGVFFTKTIFGFPSGFIFRMIRPLNLEELDSLVASFPFRLIEDAARMFLISQILLQLNHIMLHFADG